MVFFFQRCITFVMNEFKKSVAEWMDIANISDDSVEESQTKEENSYEIKSNESQFSELPRLLKIVS